MRVCLWVLVVYINEKGWVNPHDPNFIFKDFELQKWSPDVPMDFWKNKI